MTHTMENAVPIIHTPPDVPSLASPQGDAPPSRPRLHLAVPLQEGTEHVFTDSPTEIGSSHSNCALDVDCADNLRDADTTANQDRPSPSASESEYSASPGSSPTETTCSGVGWSGGSVARPHPERVLPNCPTAPYNLRPVLPCELDPNPSNPAYELPQLDEKDEYIVRAGQCKFPCVDELPAGWVRITHPV